MENIFKRAASAVLALTMVFSMVMPKVSATATEPPIEPPTEPTVATEPTTEPTEVTDPTVMTDSTETTVEPVAIESIRRIGEDWGQSATYEITLTGNLFQILSVQLIHGEESTELIAPYAAVVTANGTYTLVVVTEAGTLTMDFVESKIDTEAPILEEMMRLESGWVKTANYTFSAKDELSGVAAVTVSYNGGEPVTLDAPYTFSATENGSYEIVVTDVAGNTASMVVTEAMTDNSAPVISDITRQTAGWTASTEYTFRVSDMESGVVSVAVAVGDATPVTLTEQDGLYHFSMEGNADFMILATDACGNAASHLVSETQIDLEAPSIQPPVRQQSGWQKTATYTVAIEDTASGIASVTVTNAAGESVPVTLDGVYSFTATENAQYTITAADTVGNTTAVTVTESQLDQTAPTVDLFQRDTEGWAKEAVYSFTATDSESGVAMVTLQHGEVTKLQGNSFTLTQNGSFTLTVTDAVGNETVYEFTESQIDREAPVFENFQRQEERWATVSHYAFTVSDSSGVQQVDLKVNGQPIALTAVDGVYSFTMDANGSFTITAVDAAGNAGSYTGTEAHIDTTAPAISKPARQESGWHTGVSYAFTVEEAQSGIASVTVCPEGGSESVLTVNADGKYRFSIAANGNYIVTATDLVGNAATVTVVEEHIDTTAPEITDVRRSTDTWQQSVEYTFRVTDSQSGVAAVLSYDETPLTPDSEGIYTITVSKNDEYTIVAVDAVGNQATCHITEERIDTTAPNILGLQRTQDGWATSAAYTFTTEDTQSGIAAVTVTTSNGEPEQLICGEDGVYSFTAIANTSYTITITDHAENTSQTTIDETLIDTTEPEISEIVRQESGWQYEAVYTFTVEDTQSGIASVTVMAEGGEPQQLTEDGIYSFTADANTTYTVTVTDNVGNSSYKVIAEEQIDRTAPETVTLAWSDGFYREVNGTLLYRDELLFHMEATDSASGVATYEYRLVGSSGSDTGWYSVPAQAEGISLTFTGADDVYTLHVRVLDAVGNRTEEFQTAPAILENTKETAPAPIILSSKDFGKWTSDDMVITVSGSYAISGVEYYEYAIDYTDPAKTDTDWQRVPVVDSNAQITVSNDTNATYAFRAVSFAGNRSQVTSYLVLVQKTAPAAATLTQDEATGNNGWYTVLPNYAVHLPEQESYFAPVHYVITYTHNGSSNDVVYDGTNAPTISEDGDWTVTINAVDEAGNAATASTAVFHVDTKAPDALDVFLDGVSILNASEGVTPKWDLVNVENRILFSDFTIFKNHAVTVEATANGGHSQLAGIYVQVVSENEQYSASGNWEKLENLTLTPDSKCHLFFKAIDMAGNTTYFSAQSVLLETQEASAEITLDEANLSQHGVYSGDVQVSLAVAENDGIFSGIETVSYRVLRDGTVTQSGQLLSQGEANWTGAMTISGSDNNSDHVILEVTVTDRAGNSRTVTRDGIRIDVSAPEITGSYDNNTVTAVFQGEDCFTGSRTLTVSVTERNFVPAESFITVTDTDTGNAVDYQWQSDGSTHTAVISVTEDGHYTVAASVTDAAGNTTRKILFSEDSIATEQFIIDNTAPVVSVSYDNNSAQNGMYFSAPRTLTVTVTERNFAGVADKISFVGVDGATDTLHLSDWQTNGNIHTASIPLTKDGIYTVAVSCEDALGNHSATTAMNGTAPEHWCLDTTITAPTFGFVTEGAAYAGSLLPEITVLDQNIQKISVNLTRTRINEIGVDITDTLENALHFQDVPGGKKAVLDIFPMERSVDGLYTLTVSFTDKAGNTADSSISFFANRFGSVYVYNSDLQSLMGGYHKAIEKDLEITEYNPSGLLAGSALIQITRDGKPIVDPVFTITPDGTQVGASGWYESQYIIAKENFAEDGVYKIVTSTQDTAGNVSENTEDSTALQFSVDSTAPELPSIVGLEKAIYRADSIKVAFTAMDNIALDSITVYLNGNILQQWTKLEAYTTEQSFSIPNGYAQHIRIVVVDKAGNVLDTEAEDFAPGYAFNGVVTISSNLFLLFYANKALFFGSIATVAGGTILGITLLSKRKKQSENADGHEQQR